MLLALVFACSLHFASWDDSLSVPNWPLELPDGCDLNLINGVKKLLDSAKSLFTNFQLKSEPAAQLISFSDNNNKRAVHWADHQWNAEWADNPTRLRIFIPDTGTHPPTRNDPTTRAWVRHNCLRTGVGRFRSCLYKRGMASSAACECGAEEQAANHVILQCPIHRPPHGLHGWRFWTMRQPSGCSTSALQSSAAKQG